MILWPLKPLGGLVAAIFLVGWFECTNSLHVIPQKLVEFEGENQVHMFCLDGGVSTDIVWSDPQGNNYIPSSPTLRVNSRIVAEGSRLSVSNLERGDSGTYICYRASNITDSVEISLVVFAPPRIVEKLPVQEIHYGQLAQVTCHFDRGFPLAEVTWTRRNENGTGYTTLSVDSDPRLSISHSEREDSSWTSVLAIQSVQPSDQGSYLCLLSNDYGEDFQDILVASQAKPQFIESDLDLNIVRSFGALISLDCSAAGAPSPDYAWTIPQSAQPSVHSEPTLDMYFIGSSREGQYTCNVSNEVGFIQRNFTIRKAEEPQPKEAVHTSTLVLEEVTEVNCRVFALPAPSFKWYLLKDGDRKELTGLEPVRQEEDSLWVVSTLRQMFEASDVSVDVDCSVLLLCEAENELGTSRQTFQLSVSNPSVCEPAYGVSSSPGPQGREETAADRQPRLEEIQSSGSPLMNKHLQAKFLTAFSLFSIFMTFL